MVFEATKPRWSYSITMRLGDAGRLILFGKYKECLSQ